MRLHVLLNKQEENQVSSLKEWVTREAANQDALQEAGTFRYKQGEKSNKSVGLCMMPVMCSSWWDSSCWWDS